jgi:acetyltransferase-like isoleucine patch superfamily enzyme
VAGRQYDRRVDIRDSELASRGVQTVVGTAVFDAPGLLALRHLAYRLFVDIGPDPVISQHVRFNRPHGLTSGRMRIGANVAVNAFAEIDYSGGVTIEDDVWISQGVIIETHAHTVTTRARKKDQPITTSPLILKRDCWIGANVFISPTVEVIGEGAVIGAGSIVTKDVPDWAIAVGVPAKVIRYREG